MIAAQYTFRAHFGKNFDALYDCMTDLVHKSGPSLVHRRVGTTHAVRQRASNCWTPLVGCSRLSGDRKIPFRCFSFCSPPRIRAHLGESGTACQSQTVKNPCRPNFSRRTPWRCAIVPLIRYWFGSRCLEPVQDNI
jgi:hypothetical protein